MNTTYELWDTGTGNVIGSFPTREAALEVVAGLLASYGRDYARDLALGRREGIAPMTIVARGDDLVEAGERDVTGRDRVASVAST